MESSLRSEGTKRQALGTTLREALEAAERQRAEQMQMERQQREQLQMKQVGMGLGKGKGDGEGGTLGWRKRDCYFRYFDWTGNAGGAA